MWKEKRRVKRERKNSYVDENGVYHPHESERWSDTEVEIDQYGKVIERNADGSIKKKKQHDEWEEPISSKDTDF